MNVFNNHSKFITLGSLISDLVRHQRFVPAVFAIAIVVRLIWVFLVQPLPIGDFDLRDVSALQLAKTGVFTTDYGKNLAYLPPGHIGFLAGLYKIFGRSLTAVSLVNIMLSVGTLWLAFDIARNYSGEMTPRWTLLILGLFPSVMAQNALLSVEPLATLLVVLLTWFLLRLHTLFSLSLAVIPGVIFGRTDSTNNCHFAGSDYVAPIERKANSANACDSCGRLYRIYVGRVAVDNPKQRSIGSTSLRAHRGRR